MSNIRHTIGKVGLAVTGIILHITFYVCVAVLLFWVAKSAYEFGYQVFNQQAMSPGEGQEVTVVIQDTGDILKVGKALESKGLINNAYVFVFQEFLSNYHGKLRPGTYLLSTAYTPTRIMGIMAGDQEQAGISTT